MVPPSNQTTSRLVQKAPEPRLWTTSDNCNLNQWIVKEVVGK